MGRAARVWHHRRFNPSNAPNALARQSVADEHVHRRFNLQIERLKDLATQLKLGRGKHGGRSLAGQGRFTKTTPSVVVGLAAPSLLRSSFKDVSCISKFFGWFSGVDPSYVGDGRDAGGGDIYLYQNHAL